MEKIDANIQRTLAGALEFYQKCKANDIKPIIGQKICFSTASVILLCKDFDAYKILCRHSLELNSQAEGNSNLPFTEEECKHFICVTEESENPSLQKIFGPDLYADDSENQPWVDKIPYIFPEEYFSATDSYKRMMENLPEFDDGENLLKKLVEEGIQKRSLEKTPEVTARIEFEVTDIITRNWTNLFLMYWEITSWCRDNNIAYGPGRGASGGSLVAYLLQITDINPLEYGLLYERFANPDRVTFPDFDIDYDYEHVEDVVRHLKEKYGKENVARIATYKKLDETAPSREGLIESQGLHASGYIITKEPVYNYAPVQIDSKTGELYCEYTFDQITFCGLYKNDILGLRELSKLEKLKKLTGFDYHNIPLDDVETLKAFSKGKTDNVFQFDSPAIQKILKFIKTEKFEDLIALNALYRPGSIDYIPEFIGSKLSPETIHYPDPCLEDILKETYGIIVYQEQFMQIAQKIAGYSLGEADLLRRAMSRKNPEVLMRKKMDFVEGALKRGFKEETAGIIYEIMVPFAKYSFNKSHSVAYTKLAFWEMYMKVHFRKEYKKVIKKKY